MRSRKPPVFYSWWTKLTIHDQLAVWPLNICKKLRAYKPTNVGKLTLFWNTFPSPQIQPNIPCYSLNHSLKYIIFWVFLLVCLLVDVRKYGVSSSTRNSLASASLHSDGWRHTLWRNFTRFARKRGTSRHKADDVNWFIWTADGPCSIVPVLR